MGVAIQRSAMAPFVVMLLLSYDIDTASSEGIASSTVPTLSAAVSSNTTAPVYVPTSKPSSSSMQPSVPDEDINSISAVPTISSVDEEEPHCVDMLWANYQLLGADVPITPGYLYGLNYCKDFSSEVICEAFGHTEYAVYDDPIFDTSLTSANDACCMCGKLLMSCHVIFISYDFFVQEVVRDQRSNAMIIRNIEQSEGLIALTIIHTGKL